MCRKLSQAAMLRTHDLVKPVPAFFMNIVKLIFCEDQVSSAKGVGLKSTDSRHAPKFDRRNRVVDVILFFIMKKALR